MEKRLLEKYNLELMDSIPLVLKDPFNKLISMMVESPDIYCEADVIKLLEDLKSRQLVIKIEKVITSQNNVGNALDRVAFGYGYVDFGKESIFYRSKLDKKIVIWEEVLRSRDKIISKNSCIFGRYIFKY